MCAPNPAHLALAADDHTAQQLGQQFTITTNNIDRLHQAAGRKNVIEMHGSLW